MATFNGWEIIPMPALPAAPRTLEWSYEDKIGVAQNPITWQEQKMDWGQARLRASLAYAPMFRAEAFPWEFFLMRLRGSLNVFSFGDPLGSAPQNPAAVAGSVTGSGQTGFTLVTSSQDLTPGDWIQIGLRLYRVLTVSGGTLGIYPNLRESPANATPLTIVNTAGLFRLAANDRGYRIDVTKEYHFAFEIEEAL